MTAQMTGTESALSKQPMEKQVAACTFLRSIDLCNITLRFLIAGPNGGFLLAEDLLE